MEPHEVEVNLIQSGGKMVGMRGVVDLIGETPEQAMANLIASGQVVGWQSIQAGEYVEKPAADMTLDDFSDVWASVEDQAARMPAIFIVQWMLSRVSEEEHGTTTLADLEPVW